MLCGEKQDSPTSISPAFILARHIYCCSETHPGQKAKKFEPRGLRYQALVFLFKVVFRIPTQALALSLYLLAMFTVAQEHKQGKKLKNPSREGFDCEKTSLSYFKQFMVTNCSKERPGAIVNETLKIGILMLKDTSA